MKFRCALLSERNLPEKPEEETQQVVDNPVNDVDNSVEPEELPYTEEELETITVNVGNYVGNSRSSAEYYLGELGCQYEFVGDGNKVTAQSPAAGTSFTKSSGKIILYMGTEAQKDEYTVPDVVGMNAASANQLIINSGFAVKINGIKNFGLGADVRVLSQSPAAGTKLKAGEVVTISVAYKFTESE